MELELSCPTAARDLPENGVRCVVDLENLVENAIDLFFKTFSRSTQSLFLDVKKFKFKSRPGSFAVYTMSLWSNTS
jgi:hypothetical protein